MPYHPTIPQATDDPSNSQADILQNFMKINADFAVNHVPLTDGGNQGQHTKVFIPVPLAYTADPNLVPNQTSLYVKTAALGTNELFFQNGNLPNPSTFLPTIGLNVRQLTNLPVMNGTITNVTQVLGNARIFSLSHGLVAGNQVTIAGVYGATQVNNSYVVDSIDPAIPSTYFNVVQAGVGVYVPGTGFFTTTNGSTMNRYGVITPWNLVLNFGTATATPQVLAVPMKSVRYAAFVQAIAVFTNTTVTVAGTPLDLTQLSYTSLAPTNYYLVIGK